MGLVALAGMRVCADTPDVPSYHLAWKPLHSILEGALSPCAMSSQGLCSNLEGCLGSSSQLHKEQEISLFLDLSLLILNQNTQPQRENFTHFKHLNFLTLFSLISISSINMPTSQQTTKTNGQSPGYPVGCSVMAKPKSNEQSPGYPVGCSVMAKPRANEQSPGYPVGCSIM